jgi:hypothetical protein
MKYFSLLLVLTLSLNLSAQTANDNLNEQLLNMKNAFLEEDFSTVADYTFPKIIEMMGGKDKMVEVSKATFSKMKSQNYIVANISFKDPSEFLEYKGDLQGTIRQVLVMNTPNGRIQSETTLLAISQDDGKNWVFLDTSGFQKASLQSFYENLHPEMEIKPSENKQLDN